MGASGSSTFGLLTDAVLVRMHRVVNDLTKVKASMHDGKVVIDIDTSTSA